MRQPSPPWHFNSISFFMHVFPFSLPLVVSRLFLNALDGRPCFLFLSVSLSGSCPRDEKESHLAGTFPTHVRQTESHWRPSVHPPSARPHKHRSETAAAALDILPLHHGAFHPTCISSYDIGRAVRGVVVVVGRSLAIRGVV